MLFLVATNVVASRPPERRMTGTPHARAKSIMAKMEEVKTNLTGITNTKSPSFPICPDYLVNQKQNGKSMQLLAMGMSKLNNKTHLKLSKSNKCFGFYNKFCDFHEICFAG